MLFELFQVVVFYMNIFSIGLIGMLLIRRFFGYSLETSYVFGRIGGLLVLAYVTWLLSVLNFISFSRGYIWAVYLVMITIVLCFSRAVSVRASILKLLKLELLYFLPFVFMTAYLFMFPDITGGEKYMNFGIFN